MGPGDSRVGRGSGEDPSGPTSFMSPAGRSGRYTSPEVVTKGVVPKVHGLRWFRPPESG